MSIQTRSQLTADRWTLKYATGDTVQVGFEITSALATASTLGANAKAEIQAALGVALKDIAL